jgi:hypothetical protein
MFICSHCNNTGRCHALIIGAILYETLDGIVRKALSIVTNQLTGHAFVSTINVVRVRCRVYLLLFIAKETVLTCPKSV